MTAPLPRLGMRLHGGVPPRRAVELAVLAEAHGYASLWFAENPFARGVMPAVAAAIAATRRLPVGVGIVNPFSRHPTLIAMEFGALDELAQGRALLGIGSGIGAAVRQIGFAYDRPLTAVREAIAIVRAMLRGETVDFAGAVFPVAGARLGFRPPRPDMPIYMAAMGDRSLAACGEIADGLMISNLCPLGYTERAVAILREAANRAGRPCPLVVQYVPCIVGSDGGAARHAARQALGEMLSALWPAAGEDWPAPRETIVRHSGIARAEVAAALDRLRRGEAAGDVLDDRFVEAFAIAGTAEECLERAAAYRAAGLDELVLTFAGPDPEREMACLAAALAR